MVWGGGSIALTLILTLPLPLTPILTLNLTLILKMYIFMTPEIFALSSIPLLKERGHSAFAYTLRIAKYETSFRFIISGKHHSLSELFSNVFFGFFSFKFCFYYTVAFLLDLHAKALCAPALRNASIRLHFPIYLQGCLTDCYWSYLFHRPSGHQTFS